VAIYRLFPTLSLEPDEIDKLARAYESALAALHVADRTDPITTIIAERIIEFAKAGERDPAKLCARAIKDLRLP
jgi:hypothetical protein